MIPEAEPQLVTDPSVLDILAELRTYEPIFHRPEKGTTRADFERMTALDFWEVGASGQRYSREYVLALLERRYASPQDEILEASDFHCRVLAPQLYLLTYNLTQNRTRRTRRSTIWQSTSQGWQIVFHQGTMIQAE